MHKRGPVKPWEEVSDELRIVLCLTQLELDVLEREREVVRRAALGVTGEQIMRD